eukprot:820064_1
MSFIWNYISQVLDYFRVSDYFKKEVKLVFLGLDNAGKSTLFTLLKTGNIVLETPTDKPRSDDMMINGLCFNIVDMGGHVAMRRIWKDYCIDIDGIIFLVDAADTQRFNEVGRELNG